MCGGPREGRSPFSKLKEEDEKGSSRRKRLSSPSVKEKKGNGSRIHAGMAGIFKGRELYK